MPPMRYPLPPGHRPLINYKPRVPKPLIDLAAHDRRVMAEAAAQAAQPQPPAPEPQTDPQPRAEAQDFDAAEFPGAEPILTRRGRPRTRIE
jgi:hypothetical protein